VPLSLTSWPRTNYTATGSASLPDMKCSQTPGARPDQVTCAPVDVTVKASSVSTGTLPILEKGVDENTPDYRAGLDFGDDDRQSPFLSRNPPGPGVKARTAGCRQRSEQATFELSKLYTGEFGGFRFQLLNTALNYTQRCNFRGTEYDVIRRVNMANATWWNCTRFDNNHVNYPQHEVFTRILYGGVANTFGIEQKWYCADEDAANP
jgi:hypothetical protein